VDGEWSGGAHLNLVPNGSGSALERRPQSLSATTVTRTAQAAARATTLFRSGQPRVVHVSSIVDLFADSGPETLPGDCCSCELCLTGFRCGQGAIGGAETKRKGDGFGSVLNAASAIVID
jgi:hypothetical protein